MPAVLSKPIKPEEPRFGVHGNSWRQAYHNVTNSTAMRLKDKRREIDRTKCLGLDKLDHALAIIEAIDQAEYQEYIKGLENDGYVHNDRCWEGDCKCGVPTVPVELPDGSIVEMPMDEEEYGRQTKDSRPERKLTVRIDMNDVWKEVRTRRGFR